MKKKIIAVEGLDGVGKLKYSRTIAASCANCGTTWVKFPRPNSYAHQYIKETKPKDVNPDFLMETIMTDILIYVRDFTYRQETIGTLVCNRFLFSNFLYTLSGIRENSENAIDGCSLEKYKQMLATTWKKLVPELSEERDTDKIINHFFSQFTLETHLLEMPGTTRYAVLLNRSRDSKEQDFINTPDYQDRLDTRYDRLLKDKEVCDFFGIANVVGDFDTTRYCSSDSYWIAIKTRKEP